MTLSGQVILITGAGGGLGGTAALALAKQGAHIILLDKNIRKMEIVYDTIVAADAPEPTLYPFDLAGANYADYQQLAETLEQEYGSLQGLLHSAAAVEAFSPLANVEPQEWWNALQVNLNAPFLLTRLLLPLLQRSPSASSIVFTSDSFVRLAPAYAGAYGVAKIALEGLARILAEELESSNRIRVNTLVPGPIMSPLRHKLFPAEDKSKLASPGSLDVIYHYLFSQESDGVTGQVIDARTFFN